MKRHQLFSIIVPVYNVEQYLSKCISSILSQTYSHFELILVDDGSSDASGLICDQYANRDSRIIVIHQNNGGVSRARNRGVEAAIGEWICFVDSDDEVKPDWLMHYVNNADADLLIQGMTELFPNGHKKLYFIHDSYIEGNERCRHYYNSILFNSPCKCFKTIIIKHNHLTFREDMHLAEDMLFVLEYISVSQTMHVLSNTDYIYNHQNSTLTRRVYPANILLSWGNTVLNAALKSCNGDKTFSLYQSVAGHWFGHLSQYVTFQYEHTTYKERNEIYEFLRKLHPFIRWYRLKWTRYVFILLFLPNCIFDVIVRICSKAYIKKEL